MLKIFLSENCDMYMGKEKPLRLHRERCTAKTREQPQSLSAQHHCRTRGRLGHTPPAGMQGWQPRVLCLRWHSGESRRQNRKSGVQQPHAKSLKGCCWRKDKCCWQLGACRRESWNQENMKRQSMNPIRSLIRDCWMGAAGSWTTAVHLLQLPSHME